MVDQAGSLDSQSGQGSEGRLPPLGFVLRHQGVQQGYSNVAGPPGMPMSHDHGLMAGGFVMQPPRTGHRGAPLPHVYPPGQRGPSPSYYGGPPPPLQQSHHQMMMPRPGGVPNCQHFPPPPPPPQPATAVSLFSAPGNSPVVTPPQPPLPLAPSVRPASVAPSSTLPSHSLTDSNSHNLAGVDRSEDLNHSMLLTRSSPSVDSDMEMEDDITQLDNDHAPIQHVGETYSNNLMGGDFEAEKRPDVLQTSEEHVGPSTSSEKVLVEQGNKENSITLVPKDDKDLVTASVASDYENFSDNSGQHVRDASSFKLLQGYSSDDSLENDDKSSSRNTSLQRMMQTVTGSDSSSVQKKENESELHVNLSNIGGAGEQTAVEGTLSKVQTEAPDSRKTDRFGRLVREGVINSDSDDSGVSRRQSRRRKSRSRSSSHSRSPLDKRWRRRGKSPQRRRGKSPQRKRGNRSRSRSWSPRRWRSRRSRSPSLRRSAGFNDGNERRDRGQMGDCFNFLRGKCYRGSFCRYYHPDAERKDGPRIRRNMHQQYSRTTGAHEDIRKSPRKAASSKMLHSRDVPVQNVDDTAKVSVTNRNEPLVEQADVSLSNFVPEGKSGSSPVKCATSGTFPSADSSVRISAMLPHLPTSASFPEADNAPPGVQLGRYPNLVQHGMPFIPPYAPVANASPSSLTIPTPQLLWPAHNPSGYAEVPLPTSIGQFQSNHLPQNHGGSSQIRLGPYSSGFQDQFEVMSGSGSLPEGGILPNSGCPSHESPAMRLQSFSSTILLPGGTSTSSFQEKACSQQQQPLGVVTHSAADTIYDSGKDGNTLPPSHVETNDLSVLRRLSHYNPCASPFEEPSTSRFSSIVFQHEKGALFSAKHGHNNLTVSNVSFDGQVISNVESRQLTSLPKSGSSTGYIISGSGADLYDPFDAVGPSLTSIEKVDHNKTAEASDDSENLLRLGGSDKPLDVEENIVEVGGMDVASSFGSEEFGETANAEVGHVDNASWNNPHATKDHHKGEVEIDQDTSPGKSKKSGDSRSTKLFKACLANFVKEVLKPSWRQGNMSKEAFKTVVKKTVDKVSGAMEGRRAPKSKAKIDQYINSSQPKLTKLVLGYVDKYARG